MTVADDDDGGPPSSLPLLGAATTTPPRPQPPSEAETPPSRLPLLDGQKHPATAPAAPAHNPYWERSRPLRARCRADDGTSLYYEVHGLSEGRRRALQRRAGAVPRPPCWSAAGYLVQSAGGALEDDGDDEGEGEEAGEDEQQGQDKEGAAAERQRPPGGARRPRSPPSSSSSSQASLDDAEQDDPRPRVLLIMGLACVASAWRWTVPDLVAPLEAPPGSPAPTVVAALDNRGCGSSGAPRDPARYSTEIMAADARRVLEDLGWWFPVNSSPSPSSSSSSSSTAAAAAAAAADADNYAPARPRRRARPVHIVGFSMGGMVALKLAASVAASAQAPQDAGCHAVVASLTVLSASGGGFETIPWRSLRGLRAAACIAVARSPEAAAEATLGMHFARRTLRAPVPHHSPTPSRAPRQEASAAAAEEEEMQQQQLQQLQQLQQQPVIITRRFELLRREYLVRSSSSQPAHGFSGQLRACWRHRFTDEEAKAVRRSPFPTLVLHGRRDLLAAPALGERLARRLRCPSVHLEGAHFIVRECAAQVNALLVAVALAGPAGRQGATATAGGVAAASAAAAHAASPASLGSPPPGLPRFARAPREAQATWHLEPSPVVQAMWTSSGKEAAAAAREGGGQKDEDGAGGGGAGAGGVRRRAKAGDNGSSDDAPRVTARAIW